MVELKKAHLFELRHQKFPQGELIVVPALILSRNSFYAQREGWISVFVGVISQVLQEGGFGSVVNR